MALAGDDGGLDAAADGDVHADAVRSGNLLVPIGILEVE